jgi:hypothetical protein
MVQPVVGQPLRVNARRHPRRTHVRFPSGSIPGHPPRSGAATAASIPARCGAVRARTVVSPARYRSIGFEIRPAKARSTAFEGDVAGRGQPAYGGDVARAPGGRRFVVRRTFRYRKAAVVMTADSMFPTPQPATDVASPPLLVLSASGVCNSDGGTGRPGRRPPL